MAALTNRPDGLRAGGGVRTTSMRVASRSTMVASGSKGGGLGGLGFSGTPLDELSPLTGARKPREFASGASSRGVFGPSMQFPHQAFRPRKSCSPSQTHASKAESIYL